jgi:hypothetical protein
LRVNNRMTRPPNPAPADMAPQEKAGRFT